MGKSVYLVLGNGFTIDFLSSINKLSDVDVLNLFSFGANVPWPSNGEPGFLSNKRCPNLWNLGARPTMSREEAMLLVEDIITCMNVYMSTPPKYRRAGQPNIYIQAHRELTKYLKHLFVCYDRQIPDLPGGVASWEWAKFFARMQADTGIERVYIVTFNYDIWLERVLLLLNIPFDVALFTSSPTAKFQILKPHGSISFCHKMESPQSAFTISRDADLQDSNISDFTVRYDNLNANGAADALIPPAGDAGRIQSSWAGQIRKEAREWMQRLKLGDDLLICGLSYWHVDRSELDELLYVCNPDVDVRMINPAPARAMTAVLTSLFDTFTLYPSNRVLAELIK